jgi:thioesterase domain-containing protein/acyl carrier protein
MTGHFKKSITEQLCTSPDSAESRLVQIWQKVLGTAAITRDRNYFDLGGDSSLAVQMFAEIERVFGIKLPLATLYEAPTIPELARFVQGVSAAAWSSLVAIQPSGSRPPLFFVHGAGGTVLSYRELSEHLGPDQPFYGLQAQGLDGSSSPLTTVQEMAALYLREMQQVQPHGPYFLGGYCMGGTVAYEIAQQLVASGEKVAFLALLDTMNWHKAPLNLWTRISHSFQQAFFHLAAFLSLDHAGKARFLQEKIKVAKARVPIWKGTVLAKFGKKTEGASADSLLLARIWNINDRACWNYEPGPYAGSVTDFRPKIQYSVFGRPDLKWDKLALGGQKTIVLPVYPASMLVEPFVTSLAAAMRKGMDEAIDGVWDRGAHAAIRVGTMPE